MTNPQKTKSFPEFRQAQFHTSGEPPAADEATALVPGTRLGRYVILYRIGGGGMGIVYAAYDPELDRKVALKLLTRQMEPEQAEALTRREAQAMARLAHPNIVTVHDVCTYGDRVFIAMEHLEGQTLRDWLAAAEHSWRQVLEVFLQAGRGLAAAHSADLVHLDFKPGNVMLTGDGGVRVLDFGLAQLDLGGAGSDFAGPVEDRETPSITPGPDAIRWIATDRDAIRGTPAYLAPERIRSGSAAARSDQFSFSVALYEALYGERPFAGDTLEDHVDQIHRGAVREPTPANRVPGWLRKALLRGLASEPEDRFASMEELLQALAPEPRRARNRWLAAGSGLLALGALMAGYLRTLPERVPICAGASERLAGVWDAERKEAIRTAFLGTEIAFAGQAFENVAQVLNRYTQDWVGTHTEACEATHVRGEQSERMLDLRMMCLDGRLEEVRALTTVLRDVDARAMARSAEAARRLGSLGACSDRVELLSWRLPPVETEAREELEEIRAVVEEQVARRRTTGAAELSVLTQSVEDARRVGYPPVEAKALYLLAQVYLYVAGDTATAEETFEQALLAAISAGDRELQARIYGALVRTVAYHQSRPEDARWWQSAAEATLSALGPGHEAEIPVYQALGTLARAAGDSEKEERYMSRALEVAEQAWDSQDPRLGGVLNNAALPLGLDRIDERIRYLERALTIAEKAYGRWNPIFMGPSLTNLSVAYSDAGRHEEALAMSSRCLTVLEEFYGEHRDLTYPLVNVAFLLNYDLDQPTEAESHLRRAMPLAQAGFGEQHPVMGHLFNTLGDALARQLRYDEAETFLKKAHALRQASLPTGHRDQVDSYNSLGRLALARRRYAEALEDLTHSLSLVDEESLPDYRVYMSILTNLGETYLELGRPGQARSHLEKALGMGWAERYPRLAAEARFALARALDPGEHDRAVELATQAVEGLSGSSPMTENRRQQMERWLQANAPS